MIESTFSKKKKKNGVTIEKKNTVKNHAISLILYLFILY